MSVTVGGLAYGADLCQYLCLWTLDFDVCYLICQRDEFENAQCWRSLGRRIRWAWRAVIILLRCEEGMADDLLPDMTVEFRKLLNSQS